MHPVMGKTCAADTADVTQLPGSHTISHVLEDSNESALKLVQYLNSYILCLWHSGHFLFTGFLLLCSHPFTLEARLPAGSLKLYPWISFTSMLSQGFTVGDSL